MLMLAPQEHLRAGVVALMLKAAPSGHEEHLEGDHFTELDIICTALDIICTV